MCWRVTTIYTCSHETMTEGECDEVKELALSFHPKWKCPNYTSAKVTAAHLCGIGRVYCGVSQCGVMIDQAHKETKRLEVDLDRCDEQLKLLQAQKRWRAAELRMPPGEGLTTFGADPVYERLKAIARSVLAEINELHQQLVETKAFIYAATTNAVQWLRGNHQPMVPPSAPLGVTRSTLIPDPISQPQRPVGERPSVTNMKPPCHTPTQPSQEAKDPSYSPPAKRRRIFLRPPRPAKKDSSLEPLLRSSSEVRRSSRTRHKRVSYAEVSDTSQSQPSSPASSSEKDISDAKLVENSPSGAGRSQRISAPGGSQEPGSSPPRTFRNNALSSNPARCEENYGRGAKTSMKAKVVPQQRDSLVVKLNIGARSPAARRTLGSVSRHGQALNNPRVAQTERPAQAHFRARVDSVIGTAASRPVHNTDLTTPCPNGNGGQSLAFANDASRQTLRAESFSYLDVKNALKISQDSRLTLDIPAHVHETHELPGLAASLPAASDQDDKRSPRSPAPSSSALTEIDWEAFESQYTTGEY